MPRKTPQWARWKSEKQEDEDALRGGADGEQDLRRRGTPAHEESAESVSSSEGEARRRKEWRSRCIARRPYSSTVSI